MSATIKNADDALFARLQGAVLDGRMASLRFQQSQLIALHKSLLEFHEEICAANRDGGRITTAEAEFEYSLAVRSVKEHYESLDFDQALQDEYKVAHGKDSPNRKVGHGVLVIKPTDHTRFFSVICAVAAAIAAGCTFAIEATPCAVDRTLANVLGCLDQEIYALVTAPLSNTHFARSAIIVDQTGATEGPNYLLSRPQYRSIAVVDRTANVPKAAEYLAAACLAYDGRSPHAPDLLLVNEWVKKDFLDAFLRHAQRIRPGSKGIKNSKLDEVVNTLVTITSLVDAVQALQSHPEYLVAYHFAEPAAGKFLSQQINTRWTFINHIPAEILVGPALPFYQGAGSLHLRYTTEMFSKRRPEFIQPPTGSTMSLHELAHQTSSSVERLRKNAEQPLRPTGQGKGTSIGFFDQGIMVGAVCIVLPVVSMVGFMGWTAVRMAWQRYL